MVTCDNQSASPGGFHLSAREDEPRRSRAPSVSSISLYKQKIDALFDDSRSVTSLPQYGAGFALDLERRESKVCVCSRIYFHEDVIRVIKLTFLCRQVQRTNVRLRYTKMKMAIVRVIKSVIPFKIV